MERKSENLGSTENWDLIIKPSSRLLVFKLKDIWKYRDLLMMFVKRDIVTVYKQTILGPIWFVIQPILTTLIYVIVFGSIAKLSSDGLPKILFYLSGIIIWNYFADSLNSTSITFKENEALFGKVYFPRLISPLSKIISGLLKFLVQFVFMGVVMIYYKISVYPIPLHLTIFMLPLLVLIMAVLGLGAGIIFTSLTSKYRDLSFLLAFAVQLLMYATPVIYPMSSVPEKYKGIIEANPISAIVETFRSILLGSGHLNWCQLGYSSLFAIIVLFLGILIFNKTEKTFMDTV